MPPAVPKVDPTPRPGDLTTFEEAREAAGSHIDTSGLDSLAGAPERKHKPAPRPETKGKAPARARLENVGGKGPSYFEPPTRGDGSGEEPLGAEEQSPEDEETRKEAPDNNRIANSGEIDDGLESLAGLVKPEVKEPGKETGDEEESQADDIPEDDIELSKKVESLGPLKAVRDAHKNALKRLKSLDKESKTWKEKIAGLEAKVANYEQSGPTNVLSEQVKDLQKKIADYEDKVRTLDYTQSDEFHDNHVKPLTHALQQAYGDIAEMTIEEDGSVRKASEGDFKLLLQLPLGEAAKKAKELFGDLAQEVLAHRRAVISLDKQRQEALKSASERAKLVSEKKEAEFQEQQSNFKQKYLSVRSELADRFKELFSERPDDKDGNEQMAKGLKRVEMLVNGDIMKLPERDRLNFVADMHLRAAAYGRELLNNRRLQQRIDQLESELAGYQKSEPAGGEGTNRDGRGEEYSWETELDKLAGKRTP